MRERGLRENEGLCLFPGLTQHVPLWLDMEPEFQEGNQQDGRVCRFLGEMVYRARFSTCKWGPSRLRLQGAMKLD